jgi:Subtilisin inhibitor-like
MVMEEQRQAFADSPQAASCCLINFERAEIRVLESFPPRYVLMVSGTKPCINMKVELIPLVYIQQPEYWGIEVVGHVPGGICLPAVCSYGVDLVDPPLETKGIEVIGASERELIEIPAESCPQGSFALSITSKATGSLIAKASLTCNPAGGSHPDPEAACRQLTEADGRIEAIPEEEGPCTLEFNPVILRASGTWNGEDRRFEAEFSNRCVGTRSTGGVLFDLEGVTDQAGASASKPMPAR